MNIVRSEKDFKRHRESQKTQTKGNRQKGRGENNEIGRAHV